VLLELGHDRGYLASSPRGPFRWNRNWGGLLLRPAVGVVSPGYLGIRDEYPYWNAVFDLYRQDDLEGAVKVVGRIGSGIYADYAIAGDIVWLEAETASEGEIIRIRERCEVEIVRTGEPDVKELLARIGTSYDEVLALFGPAHITRELLMTVFQQGRSIPTAQWRDGYFTPKRDYGKICLPASFDQTALKRALVFAFAYELSSGFAALWLLEAATALLDLPLPAQPSRLNERELERTLGRLYGEGDPEEELHHARAQAQTIGHKLLARGGAEKLVALLQNHKPSESKLKSTDAAIRRTYGDSPANF
jgi:hypothetical protein